MLNSFCKDSGNESILKKKFKMHVSVLTRRELKIRVVTSIWNSAF